MRRVAEESFVFSFAEWTGTGLQEASRGWIRAFDSIAVPPAMLPNGWPCQPLLLGSTQRYAPTLRRG